MRSSGPATACAHWVGFRGSARQSAPTISVRVPFSGVSIASSVSTTNMMVRPAEPGAPANSLRGRLCGEEDVQEDGRSSGVVRGVVRGVVWEVVAGTGRETVVDEVGDPLLDVGGPGFRFFRGEAAALDF